MSLSPTEDPVPLNKNNDDIFVIPNRYDVCRGVLWGPAVMLNQHLCLVWLSQNHILSQNSDLPFQNCRRPPSETASQYSTISADGAFAPDDMLPDPDDLALVDMESSYSRRLLGGVYPEGDRSSDIVLTGSHNPNEAWISNLVSKRTLLAQANLHDARLLPEPGLLLCGDGICGGGFMQGGNGMFQL